MKAHKKEELIKLFNLTPIKDAVWKGLPMYGLQTGKQLIGVVFIMSRVELFSLTPDKKFIRIFRSEENRVDNYLDFKIILEYLIEGDEYREVMKDFMKSKRDGIN